MSRHVRILLLSHLDYEVLWSDGNLVPSPPYLVAADARLTRVMRGLRPIFTAFASDLF